MALSLYHYGFHMVLGRVLTEISEWENSGVIFLWDVSLFLFWGWFVIGFTTSCYNNLI